MKQKILITGASGRIGYSLYKSLKKKNFDVLGLCNKNKISKSLKKVDLLNKKNLKKIIKEFAPTTIFHFAAFGNHYKQKNKTLQNFKTTKNLVNAIKKEKISLVFLSTDKIYENYPEKNKETYRSSPKSEYPLFKLKCEEIIKKNLKKHLILRVPIIDKKNFNEKQYKHFSLMIIEEFVKKLKKNQKINVFKNIYRSFVYLEELTHFFEFTLKRNYKPGVYNIGSKTFSYYGRLKQAINLNKNLKKFSKNITGTIGSVKPKKQSLDRKKFAKEFGFKFN